MKNICLKAIALAVFLSGFSFSIAQDTASISSSRSFKKMDIFPAISYAPETRLTLGGIGYYYLDLYRIS